MPCIVEASTEHPAHSWRAAWKAGVLLELCKAVGTTCFLDVRRLQGILCPFLTLVYHENLNLELTHLNTIWFCPLESWTGPDLGGAKFLGISLWCSADGLEPAPVFWMNWDNSDCRSFEETLPVLLTAVCGPYFLSDLRVSIFPVTST